jgi:hypothetical protein
MWWSGRAEVEQYFAGTFAVIGKIEGFDGRCHRKSPVARGTIRRAADAFGNRSGVGDVEGDGVNAARCLIA